MWIITLVILVSIHNTLQEVTDCLTNKFINCNNVLPKDVGEKSFPPNSEELRKMCPEVLKYYECLKDYDKTCSSYDATSETITSTSDVIKEICDEGSLLHYAYNSSSQCFKNIAERGVAFDCVGKAEIVVNAYLMYRSDDGDIDDSDRTHYRYCMEKSYKMACIALKIDEMCGEVAVLTFLDILHRSKYLSPICSESTIQELNEEFLDLLDLKDAEQILVSRVFEF